MAVRKRARVSLTLRLICGYLLRSLLPFLTFILWNITGRLNVQLIPLARPGDCAIAWFSVRCLTGGAAAAGLWPAVGSVSSQVKSRRQLTRCRSPPPRPPRERSAPPSWLWDAPVGVEGAAGRCAGRRRCRRNRRRSRSPSADSCGPRPSKFCRCRWSWRRSTDSASARCDRLAGSSAGTRAAQRLALLCVAKAPCPPPHCPSRQCSSKERLSSAIAPCPPPHCLSRQCSAKERLSALLDLLKYQWCTGRPWCRVSCRRNL